VIAAAIALAVLALPAWALAADAPSHRFQELAPGIHFATGTGSVFTLSNALLIVDDAGVTVVDSHVTPAATRALIASMKTITTKPITTVINTHYHFDHAHGNLAFPAGVTIIGHEFTREKLAGDPMNERTYKFFSKLFAENAQALAKQAAEAKDPQAKAGLDVQAAAMANFVRDDKETRPVPPTVTLSERMTLHRGAREIELLFLGRGHTGGDVVVFLPNERIVFTGDLLLQGPSYMGDAYLDEWVETIDKVKALDFDIVVPGHGEPFRDRASIDAFQAYMRDTWDQVLALRAKGVSALEAALRIDLTKHRKTMGPFASPLLPSGILAPGIEPNAVLRIYELLDQREAGQKSEAAGGGRPGRAP
jgi:glyoxylase-like metal-dependent hydrolase (beta-lactamase superfamily II)